MSRPKILYCHPGAELYGSDRMALETIYGLVREGYEVDVVVPGEGPFTERLAASRVSYRTSDIPVLRKELIKSGRGVFRLLYGLVQSIFSVAGIIRSRSVKIVYVNTLTQPSWIIGARLMRCQVICHVREDESGLGRLTQKLLVLPLAFTDRVIANSGSTAAFVRRNNIVAARKTCVVLNGKDWTPYYRSDPTRLTTSPRLVVVGRISPRKGQDIVLRAMAELMTRGISPTLTLVGDVFPGYEWYENELRALAVELHLEARCHFGGFTADIADALEAADIVLVPSRSEPFGTVALEGMGAMRPVIAARVQGLQEIVEDSMSGLLVEPDDHHALAKEIERLCRDPELAGHLARAGYERANTRFSADTYRKRITQIVGGGDHN